jgi:hypothetical protein
VAQAHRSERDVVVRHVLRCIGFAGEDRVAAAAGLEMIDVIASLEALTADGFVSRHEGVFGGWGLTDDGRAADARWLASELDGAGARAPVRAAYDSFSPLNPKLLQICHDWQMQGVSGASFLNDHTDAAYDARVIDRLVAIDGAVRPILDALSGRLARFSTYRPRLGAALERVTSGDHSYFTDGVESYHSVWFQLHEDLLTTLGIDRADEAR